MEMKFSLLLVFAWQETKVYSIKKYSSHPNGYSYPISQPCEIVQVQATSFSYRSRQTSESVNMYCCGNFRLYSDVHINSRYNLKFFHTNIVYVYFCVLFFSCRSLMPQWVLCVAPLNYNVSSTPPDRWPSASTPTVALALSSGASLGADTTTN